MRHHGADTLGLLVGEHITAAQRHLDGCFGLGGNVLQHIGPVLTRRDDDVRVQHAVHGANVGLQLLLGGDKVGLLPLGVGGHGPYMVPVAAVEAAVLGVALLGQLGNQGRVLAAGHHDRAADRLIIGKAAVLQVGRNLLNL